MFLPLGGKFERAWLGAMAMLCIGSLVPDTIVGAEEAQTTTAAASVSRDSGLLEPAVGDRTASTKRHTGQQAALIATKVDQALGHDNAAARQRRTTDEQFLRRVYVDLIGRNPNKSELEAFLSEKDPNKRTQIVDRLLDDSQFGGNWANYWRDVIMYRRSEDRARLAEPALTRFLEAELNENSPWDEIVRAFITASGDVRENGATGLIMAQNGDTDNLTSEISRIFTGIQIQCAQCHDHKTDRWKREQFHQLAAFVPRVVVRPVNTEDRRTFEVQSIDLAPQRLRANARLRNRGEHFMPDLEDPSARGTKMDPVFFVTGQSLPPGKTDSERREALATWITSTNNEWFAKAFVNRIWAELVGTGFYEPIDDLGPDRDCAHPEALEALSKEFVDSGYDIKQLYRTITATAAYQAKSRARSAQSPAAFDANCTQRLRADQLASALESALGVGGVRGGLARREIVRGPQNQINQVFGFDPSEPRDEVVGTIPQALMLMNSPTLNRQIVANRRTELGRLLQRNRDDEGVATALYVRCLGREPNPKELQTCLAHVRSTGDRGRAFEDILWALVNSTEFIHRN